MRLFLILGPTGVGKTDRSILMAQKRCAPVITLDRFQVFEELATGTGRPHRQQLAGTERIFLADRKVSEGELTAEASYLILMELLGTMADRPWIILEGGSISLCSLLFERGFFERFQVDIDFRPVPGILAYSDGLKRRVLEMLSGSTVQRSMLTELALLWHDPDMVSFVETIVGYDVLVQYCRQQNITPYDMSASSVDAALVDKIVDSHLAYSRWQSAVFERLLGIYPAIHCPARSAV